MEKKWKVWLALFVLVLSVAFRGGPVAAHQHDKKQRTILSAASSAANRVGSSIVFPVHGNVHPVGFYYAALDIGYPPKPYFLDIDTGSDLTWLQCDAPCVRCSKVPHPLYRPKNLILGKEPICASVQSFEEQKSNDPNEQCDYSIEYADHCSSLGVLVRDVFPLRFTNGSLLIPHLAFGCGYDQQGFSEASEFPTDGVLGLGNGESSIISQLRAQGLTQNVFGHCFSRHGGFLFLGDDVVPSSGIVWTPISHMAMNKYYSPGLAELFFGGKPTGVKGLRVAFDSGSTYTYLNSKAYQALVSAVKKDLTGKSLREALDDDALPICWKGAKPFKSMNDVNKYFKPAQLSFSNGKKVHLEITPESYLIITSQGNVCLGILNGTEKGLHELNLIGDISMQDKMVIYDNEKQQIGWGPANCDRLPNVDHDDEDDNGGFSHPYAASLGIL